MSYYVDGFVLPVPKDKIEEYRKMAETAAEVWMDHGALAYRECVGDDLVPSFGLPFTKLANTNPDETVVFAWIMYPSREDRDRINASVMADPRLQCDPANMPFDCQRMAYGGFKTLVSAEATAVAR